MKIAVDFDSTLYDFMSVWLEKIQEEYDVELDRTKINTYHYVTEQYPELDLASVYRVAGFYDGYEDKVYAGASSFLSELKALPFVTEVVIVSTATGGDEALQSKQEFIEGLFGHIVDGVILTGYDKWNFTEGYVIIDDNLEVVAEHCKKGNFGICYTRDGEHTWNTDALAYALRRRISRVGLNYDQIVTILKLLNRKQPEFIEVSEYKDAAVGYKGENIYGSISDKD